MTADGRWIVYASVDPQALGVHRIRPDGSDDELLVEGAVTLPDVAPVGSWLVLSGVTVAGSLGTQVRVIDIETGGGVDLGEPIVISAPPARTSGVTMGRPRWLPGAAGIAFVGLDGVGLTGIYIQDVRPGTDTSATLRLAAGAIRGELSESFDVSPDGRFITIALQRNARTIVLADRVPGLE